MINLSYNQIGDEGATSLTNILLLFNKVEFFLSLSLFMISLFFLKTIEEFDLSHNQIGDEGARKFARCLRYHGVKFFLFLCRFLI